MENRQMDTAFEARFAERVDELKWLFCELYHNNQAAWSSFAEMLRRLWQDRPVQLKELDNRREADPDWYKSKSLLGMVMYVQAFAQTLRGLEQKLDYVQECGANVLHLMPLLQSPEGRNDGGYAVSDFTRVQPELGTMEDLNELSQECHSRGISLCLDFVMNHTSEDHEWAKKARAGDRAYQNRYFFYNTWDIPNAYEQTMPQVFPTTAPGNFTWCEEAQQVVMTTFYPYQWDLNYANPVVFRDMTEYLLNLCNHGIDIIRLDAVPYIWKALGTSCRNLPQVHTLVRMLRLTCEIVCPATLLLGEVVMEPSRVVPYFGTVEKPECHLLYNVTTMATIWHTVATRDTALLNHQLAQVFSLPKHCVFLNYLRCHDDIGWGLDYGFLAGKGLSEVSHKKYLNDYFTGKWPGSVSRGELYNDDPRLGDARLCGTTASLCGIEAAKKSRDVVALHEAVQLDLTLHALMMTLSGLPMIYSGDEIAQENDLSYHDQPLKADDSRYLHRGNMDWEKAEKRTDPAQTEGKVFRGLRRLEQLRTRHMVFDTDASIELLPTANEHVLGISRSGGGEKLLALFNFSEHEETALPRDRSLYLDLMTGESLYADAVRLPAKSFAWLLMH